MLDWKKSTIPSVATCGPRLALVFFVSWAQLTKIQEKTHAIILSVRSGSSDATKLKSRVQQLLFNSTFIQVLFCIALWHCSQKHPCPPFFSVI